MGIKSKKRKTVKSSKYFVKLTSKYQATIPKEIRKHLNLERGDEILYEVLPDNTVVIRKSSLLDLEYLQAIGSTMNEWESAADNQVYKNL